MRQALFVAVAGLAVILNATAQEKPKMNEATALQVVEIQKQIELLKVHNGQSPFLTLSEVGGEATVQLARNGAPGKRTWSLNIAYYPSKDTPAKSLAAVGMALPTTWQQEQFEAGTFAQYGVPESDLAKLPQFIHDLFIKFFKRPATYKLAGCIDDM